jgi:hypothetical protein
MYLPPNSMLTSTFLYSGAKHEAVDVEPVVLDRLDLGRVQVHAQVAQFALLPVTSPHRIRPTQALIASDDDSWLLPHSPRPTPEAQEWPS